jgi:lipoprotein-releasing system ATP-binding protein
MSKPLLRTLKLVKNYIDGSRTLEVLRGVEFALHPGEVVAITGKSGSGKSTLLTLLCMLDRPTSGTIYYNASSSGDAYSLAEIAQRPEPAAGNRSAGVQFHHCGRKSAWRMWTCRVIAGGG